MALVKFGGGITQMSGSIAGNTFARNRYGNYVRSRTKPVNPNSTSQSAARTRVGSLVQLWRTLLNGTQRIAWASYANAVAMKNKLGETTYLSGFNHFIRGNSLRLQCGLALQQAGPAVLALPEKDPTFAIAIDQGTQLITVTFDPLLPWFLETGEGCLQIEMGEPQNPTRNFFAGPWKYAGNILAGAAGPFTLTPPYYATLGQKIFAYGRIIREDARASEPMFVSCIVGT